VKRAMDVVIASVGLLLGGPVLAAAMAAIRLESPGHPIYRQRRIGRDGEPFDLYKLRTMVHGAEHMGAGMAVNEGDSRITRVGAFLRRTSLDELPNLVNVVRGDMSIVGPRPERPYFVEQFKHRIPQYMLRHKVKAGITGWAQVNGWRGNTSLEKRIEYDLYYIENWSVGLDIKIMWLTVIRGFHRHAF
jgi:putative colanic acid biosysnthesis UDP-glucose lipid carrier transferase